MSPYKWQKQQKWRDALEAAACIRSIGMRQKFMGADRADRADGAAVNKVLEAVKRSELVRTH
jgi:hypothetical protein